MVVLCAFSFTPMCTHPCTHAHPLVTKFVMKWLWQSLSWTVGDKGILASTSALSGIRQNSRDTLLSPHVELHFLGTLWPSKFLDTIRFLASSCIYTYTHRHTQHPMIWNQIGKLCSIIGSCLWVTIACEARQINGRVHTYASTMCFIGFEPQQRSLHTWRHVHLKSTW